ncbi:hypothetical protein B0H14DRAFT_2879476 [Mycena olivaceomarginata]|nr:hypothetical protein B0H14DRAFT_2879476 [Mycena olivaceomarginata]
MDGNLATTYTLIHAFLTKRSHSKAAEALKKAAKDVVILKDNLDIDGPQLDDIIRDWKTLQAARRRLRIPATRHPSSSASSASKKKTKTKTEKTKKPSSSSSSDSDSSSSDSEPETKTKTKTTTTTVVAKVKAKPKAPKKPQPPRPQAQAQTADRGSSRTLSTPDRSVAGDGWRRGSHRHVGRSRRLPRRLVKKEKEIGKGKGQSEDRAARGRQPAAHNPRAARPWQTQLVINDDSGPSGGRAQQRAEKPARKANVPFRRVDPDKVLGTEIMMDNRYTVKRAHNEPHRHPAGGIPQGEEQKKRGSYRGGGLRWRAIVSSLLDRSGGLA